MMVARGIAALLSAALVAIASAEDPGQGPASSTNNILENLEEAGDYSILIMLLEKAGLSDTVAEYDGLTLFAPTDDAFGTSNLLGYLLFLADPDALTHFLLYHAVDGAILSSDLDDGMVVPTLYEGEDGFEDVVIGVGGGNVMVNTASVVEADVISNNGVVHGIGTVLIYPMKWYTFLYATRLGPNFSTLFQVLEAIGGPPPEDDTTLFGKRSFTRCGLV